MKILRGLTWQTRRGYAPLTAASAEFQLEHQDVTIDWIQLPWLEFAAEQRRALATADDCYDLVMFDQPWTGDYANARWLLPLEGLLPPEVLADAAGAAGGPSWSAYRYNNRQWGMPVDAACQTLAVRADLVAGDLDDDPDWQSLLQWAGDQRLPSDHYPFAVSCAPVNQFLMFLSITAALGARPYEDPNDQLDHDAGALALELLREIRKVSLPCADLGDQLPVQLLSRSDRVLMAPAAFPFPDAHAHRHRPIRVGPMPKLRTTGRRTSALGGVGLGVNAASRYPAAAAAFVAHAMSATIQSEAWVRAGGLPGRRDALRGSAMQDLTGDLGVGLADQLTECYTRPHWPGWSFVEERAGRVVAEHLAGEYNQRETLVAVQQIVTSGPQHAVFVD